MSIERAAAYSSLEHPENMICLPSIWKLSSQLWLKGFYDETRRALKILEILELSVMNKDFAALIDSNITKRITICLRIKTHKGKVVSMVFAHCRA
jgi:hypothetical protein